MHFDGLKGKFHRFFFLQEVRLILITVKSGVSLEDLSQASEKTHYDIIGDAIGYGKGM